MIPPGIDEARFTPATPSKWPQSQQKHDLRETDIYVVGRAAENKGYDLDYRGAPEPLEDAVGGPACAGSRREL
jgi:mannosylfructose-phosphate synthase